MKRRANPRLAQLLQADRPAGWASFANAMIYALQMVAGSVVLFGVYHVLSASGVGWAIVSVALVLNPDMQQSLAVSLQRIAANLLGAGVGLGIGLVLGDANWQFLIALVVVIALVDLLRLDQALRTAVVAVVVVMLSHEGSVLETGVHRFLSVAAGCATGLVIQYVTTLVRKPRAEETPPPPESRKDAAE